MKSFINILLIIVLSILYLFCKKENSNSSIFNQSNIIPKQDTIIKKTSNSIENIEQIESFDAFIAKFIVDKQFQSTRIVSPLYLYELDDNEQNSNKFTKNIIGVEDIFLSQRDWDEKINLIKYNLSIDTIEYILEGKETGLKIIHQFVSKDNKWYLNKITDISM